MGNLDLGGANRTFTVSAGTQVPDLIVLAQVSNGAISKDGNGVMELANSNQYGGDTTINAGILDVRSATLTLNSLTGIPQTLTIGDGAALIGFGQVNANLVGSGTGVIRASGGDTLELRVSVTSSNSLEIDADSTLKLKGKPLSILKAGRYKFSVNDLDAKAGLSLQAVGTKTKVTALSAAEFVGSHTTTVQLAPGRWMYFAKGGAPHYFLVTR